MPSSEFTLLLPRLASAVAALETSMDPSWFPAEADKILAYIVSPSYFLGVASVLNLRPSQATLTNDVMPVVNQSPEIQDLLFRIRHQLQAYQKDAPGYEYPTGYLRLTVIIRDIHIYRAKQKAPAPDNKPVRCLSRVQSW